MTQLPIAPESGADSQPPGDVAVADSDLLLGGRLWAEGADLVIAGADGTRTQIAGYFDTDHPADLVGPDGLRLAGWLVAETTIPRDPAGDAGTDAVQVAQADAARIGVVQAATGTVLVTHADGTREELGAGDPVYAGDEVVTGHDAAVGIVFLDDTTFSLAGDGRIVLDEMIYDPTAGDGSAALSIFHGAFTFVSGQIAKIDPDGMVLKTPAATIGIRGTAGAGDVADGGATRATLLEERGQPVGELVFNNDGGTQVVNVLGALVTVASFAAAPRVTPITVQAVGQQFGRAIVFLPNADRHLPDTLRNTVRQILDGRDDGAPGLNPADTGQADVDQSAASTSDSDPRDGDQSDTGQSDAGDGGTGLGGSRVVAALQDGVAPNTATGVDKAAVASLLGAEGAGKSTLLSEVVHVTKLDVLQAVADKIADLRPTAKVDELVEAKNPFANLERGNSGLLSDTAKEAEKVNEVIQEQNSKTDSSVVDVAELVRAATTKILEAKEADRETGIEDSIGLGKNTGSTVNGTGHADVLKGTSGTDIINGGAGNDDIQGGAGNDLLNGGAGNDTLDGGADNDVIHGDAGNDIIIGGLGSDTLFGGPNHDTFRMNSPLEGADYLADFQPGTDTLALLASAFNNPSFFTTSTYPAGNAGSGSGAPSVILYDGTGAVASQVVFYDQDGMNTGYSVVPLAVLPSGTTITLSDITLV